MNFVSHTVVVDFTAGAAMLIAASQVKSFFGVAISRGANFPQVVAEFATQAVELNPWVTLVASATLASSLLVRHYRQRWPHMVVALVAGSVLALLMNLVFGPERTGIATLGALPQGLPPLSSPDLSISTVRQVLPIAIALAILSLTEAMSIARSIAMKTEQRVDSNQEFIGQGLSNIVGAFFSAYPSSGSFNRSGLNLDAGARTPLAAVFSALLLIVIVQFIAPLIAYLPTAAMAGVLFLVAWGLIDIDHIVHILRTNRQETVVLVMTFLATLLMDLQFAIYVGVLLSLLLYLNRTSRPSIEEVKPAVGEGQYHFANDTGLPDCPQFKMLRINGSLFFGAAEHVQEVMMEVDAQDPGQKHLMLTCPGVNFIDLAGGELLVREARRRRRLGGDLYLFNLKDTARETLRAGGYEAVIGSANIVPLGTRDPVAKIFDRLDPRVCATCTRRIFRQCSTMPGPPPAPPKVPADEEDK
jgi:SulP family sulfate permease